MPDEKRPSRLPPEQRAELLDGYTFLILQSHDMPTSIIATLANFTEAEVKRLIELAKRTPHSGPRAAD